MARRHTAAALLVAFACLALGGLARADEAPAYTLEVDSDAPGVRFDTVAAQLAGDLRSPIERPGNVRGRVVLRIYYRVATHELAVRVDHGDGRILERTVKATGDDTEVVREATLLAGELTRDEAQELLDALASHPARAAVAPPPAPVAPPVPEPDYGVTFALVYPIASNVGRPNVTSHYDLSLFLGRVGHVSGAQLSGLVGYAGRGLEGVQLATALGVVDGSMRGVQVAGLVSVVHGPSHGIQLALAANVRTDDARGVQLGAFNVARTHFTGVQLAGPANVVTGVTGLQLGVVNVANEASGLQLGLVNIGRHVRGAQLGLVAPPALPSTALPSTNVSAPPPFPTPSAPVPTPEPTAPSAPDPSSALFAEAHRLHFMEKDPAKALPAWDAYLKAAPDGPLAPEAHYNRALALVRLDRRTEAVSELVGFANGSWGGYRRAEAKALLDALVDAGR